MADFVSASSLTTDPSTLTDNAIDAVNSRLAGLGFPGWTANDATLAVILLGTIGQMLADVAVVAASVLPAIFRAFGTQLFGIPYQQGANATVTSTWTFTSPAPTGGYEIDAGTAVIVSGQVFYVQSTVVTSTAATSASIVLVASQSGVAYNGLGGVNTPVQSNDEIDWVASIVTVGVTSGGLDQETDEDYQNRLANVLTLQAPRPLVAADFAGMLLSDIAENATGVAVGRATSIDGYYPDGRALSTGGAGSTVLSCTTANASPTVTLAAPSGSQVPAIGATVTGTGVPGSTLTADTVIGSPTLATVSSFTGVGAGTQVTGSGIPAGATVLSVNEGASTALLSVNATATASGVTLTPTQTVLASPAPTESTFTLSVNATTSATNNLTFSALSGYGPVHLTCVGTTTSTSPTISAVIPPYPGAIPDVGARVTGTAIPAGTTVLASPAPTSSSFTLSANATGSHTGETVTVSSWTSVQLTNCAFVTDVSGNALSSASMDALATWLAGYRPQNWLTAVEAPGYYTVYLTALVKVLPGFTTAAVGSSVQTALMSWLSPASWGNPGVRSTGANAWLNSAQGYGLIRWKKAIEVAGSVPGVDFVDTLTLGFSPSPGGTSDLQMTGPAPLPQSTVSTIIVTTE